jgi:DNA invertase Pin-like site-specific DNA recombinase
MKPVALYLRVSTKDQTTANQLHQLEDLCTRREWEIVRVYKDAESGSKGRGERSEFDAMFRDARAGKFALIVFWSVDRFSREGVAQTFNYLQLLDSYGVRFYSHEEQYLETENEMVRDIVLAILAAAAKAERVRLSSRTKAGLERAKRDGKKLGRPTVKGAVQLRIAEIGPTVSPQAITNQLRKEGLVVSVSTVRRYLKRENGDESSAKR